MKTEFSKRLRETAHIDGSDTFIKFLTANGIRTFKIFETHDQAYYLVTGKQMTPDLAKYLVDKLPEWTTLNVPAITKVKEENFHFVRFDSSDGDSNPYLEATLNNQSVVLKISTVQ